MLANTLPQRIREEMENWTMPRENLCSHIQWDSKTGMNCRVIQCRLLTLLGQKEVNLIELILTAYQ